jgi:hypothetical protein
MIYGLYILNVIIVPSLINVLILNQHKLKNIELINIKSYYVKI